MDRFEALAVLITDLKGSGLPPACFGFIESHACYRGDSARRPDDVFQSRSRRQWIEVAVDELATRRIDVRLGGIPAGHGEKTRRGAIDVVFPRREQLHMPPLADRMGRLGACFQHDGHHVTLKDMCRSSKPDRPSSDNRDDLGAWHFDPPIFLESWKF